MCSESQKKSEEKENSCWSKFCAFFCLNNIFVYTDSFNQKSPIVQTIKDEAKRITEDLILGKSLTETVHDVLAHAPEDFIKNKELSPSTPPLSDIDIHEKTCSAK